MLHEMTCALEESLVSSIHLSACIRRILSSPYSRIYQNFVGDVGDVFVFSVRYTQKLSLSKQKSMILSCVNDVAYVLYFRACVYVRIQSSAYNSNWSLNPHNFVFEKLRTCSASSSQFSNAKISVALVVKRNWTNKHNNAT